MSFQRTGLASFLASAKASLKAAVQHQTPVTFVVGNESADLDSLCSTLLYAYLRTQAAPYNLHIPLSNLQQEDLTLRPELKPVLSKARLQPSDLITLSDLSFLANAASESATIKAAQSSWVLIDHNALTGPLANIYAHRAVGCIDHHDDEGSVPKNCGDEPRIIQKSGSCASLVVAHCRKLWDADAAGSEQPKRWDAELAQLALAPILIDTNNLCDKTKVTDVDMQAVEFLEKWAGEGFKRDEYFKEVSEAKQDIGDLNLVDVLRKDYKMWEENGMKLGVSSVVKNMNFLVEKAGGDEHVTQALRTFGHDRDLSLFAVMTTSNPDGNFTRELLVFGFGDEAVKLCKRFEEQASSTLGLKTWKGGRLDTEGGSREWSRCWIQERVENSRKQVGPLLRKAMR
ncbi:MAG: Exopolyphosphatase [Claussenomyces sp. TS43310]|nr:MAG: Exopolyphosphatase [Claussenomyces sp. TS43310]